MKLRTIAGRPVVEHDLLEPRSEVLTSKGFLAFATILAGVALYLGVLVIVYLAVCAVMALS